MQNLDVNTFTIRSRNYSLHSYINHYSYILSLARTLFYSPTFSGFIGSFLEFSKTSSFFFYLNISALTLPLPTRAKIEFMSSLSSTLNARTVNWLPSNINQIQPADPSSSPLSAFWDDHSLLLHLSISTNYFILHCIYPSNRNRCDTLSRNQQDCVTFKTMVFMLLSLLSPSVPSTTLNMLFSHSFCAD